MKGELHSVYSKGFIPLYCLDIDISKSMFDYRDIISMREVFLMAKSCMIGVTMRNNTSLNWSPCINVNICLLTVNASVIKCK